MNSQNRYATPCMQRTAFARAVLRRLAFLPVAAILLCLSACWDHGEDLQTDEPEEPVPTWDGKYYLQLVLNPDQLNASRADGPQGGESGDGDVTGKNDENTITNATFIIYKKSIAAKAFNADDKVFAVLYFGNFALQDGYWVSTPVELPFSLTAEIKATQFYATVVTNAGNMSTTFRSMTLPKFSNYLFTAAQKSTNGFVMSSTNEFSLMFDGSTHTTYDETTGIYTSAEIRVQRLMARIDLAVDATLDGGNANYKTSGISLPEGYSYSSGVRYQVYTRDDKGVDTENTNENTNEYFLLTDFEVLNSYTGSSYLIKRVAANAEGTSDVAYFGTETKNGSYNYVVSPADNKAEHFTTQTATLAEAAALPHPYTVNSVDKTSYTVGYVGENTNRAEHYTTLRLNGFIGRVANETPWDYSSAKRQSYEIVLRHSDPDNTGTKDDIMHFGVVRNNIYRVGINKIVRMSVGSAAVYWYYYKEGSTSEYLVFETSISPTIEEDSDKIPND